MKKLPIDDSEAEIISEVRENQVTVILGETGSGKTTQVPIMLYNAGFAKKGMIGVTQPRKIAAMAIAEYVAGQLGSELGKIVGYKVRFDDLTERKTAIKFVTNGVLLREIQNDPQLTKYSIIVLDEAHERSLEIDLLLGLIKNLLKTRKDLKLIITSATINAEKFLNYFKTDSSEVPVVLVGGRMYPVEVTYLDWNPYAHEIVSTAVEMVVSIHVSNEPGDVLVFMTGRDDISAVVKNLFARLDTSALVLPLYGGMEDSAYKAVFQPCKGKRKIIVATNIAETSLTINGIRFVVDSGLIKQQNFDSKTGMVSLDIIEHSMAGCEQRKGRAGRTQPGVCYRLYSQKAFQARSMFTLPEIQRMSLSKAVLIMESMGISDVERFDLIDPPSFQAFREAYQVLVILGANDFRTKKITALGRKMAELPLEPCIARMLIEAEKYRCVKSIAVFAAFQSVPHVFMRPRGKEEVADRAHQQFAHPKSDALTLITVWNKYVANGRKQDWCYRYYLNSHALEEVELIYSQLLDILERNHVSLPSTMNEDVIMKCVVSGLVFNLIEHDSRWEYQGIFQDMKKIGLHPSSSLYRALPRFVVATSIVRTTQLYARCCTVAPIEWLAEFLPELFKCCTPVLLSYTKEEVCAIGEQSILFKGREVVRRKVRIPLELAKRLNAQKDIQMRSKRLVRLVFVKHEDRYIADCDGVGVEMSKRGNLLSVRADIPYYCEVVHIGPVSFAHVQEEAIDLGEKANELIPVQKVEKPIVTADDHTQSLAEELAHGWGLTLEMVK